MVNDTKGGSFTVSQAQVQKDSQVFLKAQFVGTRHMELLSRKEARAEEIDPRMGRAEMCKQTNSASVCQPAAIYCHNIASVPHKITFCRLC